MSPEGHNVRSHWGVTGAMSKSKNERITENLVRDALRALSYYDEDSSTQVQEQKSNIEAVKKLLKTSSKSKAGGTGSPEFIITDPSSPDFIMLIECKASTADHQSQYQQDVLAGKSLAESDEDCIKRVKRFAVDGVLHYASFLAREFNVVALAVSGETKKGLRVSAFLHTKGSLTPAPLRSRSDGQAIEEILPWSDFIDHAIFDPAVRRARLSDLMEFARDLHVFMRDHAKLTESQKPLLVSGTLIALRNEPFAHSYGLQSVTALPREWMKVIKAEINSAEIPQGKKETMTQPYASIAVHPELGKATKAYPKGVLHELIRRIHEKAAPFISANESMDILGQFYGEFLKYTGGDKKALGIVLTPRHVTELFALLANVQRSSTVIDLCAGTGGFLISAMSEMMRGAQTDAQRRRIKRDGLIGVEQQPEMFALAASNMILRGDGKANLYQGSCFDPAISAAVKDKKPDIGLLNPPFSQGDADLHELRFIQHMLSHLTPGGVGLAIVPISCAISPHPIREELLKEHTLDAVMSMPPELFHPVGVVSCVMAFTAHKPHRKSNKKTWFGYWRDDGFVKTKHKGRVDLYGRWSAIRDRWVEQFTNREVVPGQSVSKQVKANDEWCAEAYMETDYSTVSEAEFDREIKKYVVFNILNEQGGGDEDIASQ